MKDFAAIDFETVNNERSSVCSVGIVIVRNGEIVDTFYSLNARMKRLRPCRCGREATGIAERNCDSVEK